MKHLLLALLLAALASAAALADTPASISEDYHRQADAALVKLNDTLEKATTPLIAALIKAGDTAGAGQLTEQLKAKTTGEPVPKPQASATLLFAQYDQARAKALEPVQKAAIARIDAMLSGPAANQLETVTALGKVRLEVEAGGMAANTAAAEATTDSRGVPGKWSYHMKPEYGASGTMVFKKNGDMELWIKGRRNADLGTWKKTKTSGLYEVRLGPDEFPMTVTDDTAVLDMPQIGKRYLKLLEQ